MVGVVVVWLVWVSGRQRATDSGQQAAGDGQQQEMGSSR